MNRYTLAIMLSTCLLAAACGEKPVENTIEKKTVENSVPAPVVVENNNVVKNEAQVNAASSVYSVGDSAVKTEASPATAPKSKEDQIKLGKVVYESNCMACHGVEGLGVEGAFPPLAKSDYLNKDFKVGIHAVLKGVNGKITVNGKEYNGVMPPVAIGDEEIANVLTYVVNSFGNKGGQIHSADVAKLR